MKKLLISNIYFLLIFSRLCAQTLSPDDIKEDLRIFREGLEKFHPELYRYTDQKVIDFQFQELESNLVSPLSQQNFYNQLRPLLATIKDGHIKWIVKGKDQHYGFHEDHLFPVKLYFEENKVFTLTHYSGEDIPSLAEILDINGIPIQQVKDQMMSKLMFGDGESLGGKYYQLNRYFSAYFATEFGVSDTYTINLEDGGIIKKWSGKGVSRTEIEKIFAQEQSPFSFTMPNGWTGILKISRFFSLAKEPDLKKFLGNSFESLEKHGISNLILDLRGNEGGNERIGVELYKYLALADFRYYDHITTKPNQKVDFESATSKLFRLANSFSKEENGIHYFTKSPGLKKEKPHKSAFKGNVILLLDGQSFSVTTEFASRAKSDGRVYIIGEETAGGADGNNSGFFTIITLPHSQIDLGVPRMGFHMADLNQRINPNRGILPDEQIIPTALDIHSGYDPVMERAFQLVQQQNN